MLSRRAQAAMEFLVTYGWAMLAILVAIGALTYFGATRFDLGGRCIFAPGFECRDFVIIKQVTPYQGLSTVMQAKYSLVNDLGDAIIISSINANASSSSLYVFCAPSKTTVGAGEQFEVTCTFTDATNTIGAREKVGTAITYTSIGGVYPHTVYGESLDKIQAQEINWDGAGTVNDAACVSITAPNTVSAGQAFQAIVVMRNSGPTAWATNTYPFRLGLWNPQDSLLWQIHRLDLPSGTVPPGGTATFTINAIAPSAPGTYNFDWRMVEEWVTWFGATCPKSIVVT